MKILGLLIAGALTAFAQSALASVIFMPADTSQELLQTWGRAREMPRMEQPVTAGPVKFGGGITFRSTHDQSVFGYGGGYGFGSNGAWNGETSPMAGLNAAVGALTFEFETPVSSFLAEMNWAPGDSGGEPIFMSIFNAAGDLLETFALSDLEHGDRQSGYYGFHRTDTDISRIVLSNGYFGARNLFTQEIVGGGEGGGGGFTPARAGPALISSPAPEPATWALMLLGFGAAGASLRRRLALQSA